VLPDWDCKNTGLSSDDDLREQQLRWLRDDIWMRRLVFGVALLGSLIGIAAPFMSMSPALLAGADLPVLAMLAYFFALPRRPPRARLRAPPQPGPMHPSDPPT
jgi:hypothetical protein